ncbi:MAG: divergent polysaccharide deacetylase family protein [Deltaproteobacteria bacterium]|nr:divergent polysaccharide deacetylase family protein [Deltaproteobacteria bacterium]
MAKRKPTRKKRRSKKPRQKSSAKSPLFRALAGLAILALGVVAIGILLYYLAPPETTAPRSTAPKVPPARAPVVKQKPTYEIYPSKIPPPARSAAKKKIPQPVPKPRTGKSLPSVALIIDDLGYDKQIAKKFAQLNVPLTFSILPHSPFQQKIVRLAESKGLEIMLHLPMEPNEYPTVDPGPGTLLASMSADELITQLDKNLKTLPNVKGVNNHMGSRLTAESTQLYQIFSVLKKRGLYFIDSRTTAESLCEPSARLFQIPFAQRDVFLDHYPNPDFIRKQIKELIRVARHNGQAVGILHPHATTLKILQEMLPDLQKQVYLVPASKIVRPVG